MPNYYYTAKSLSNKTATGTIQARDTRELAKTLKTRFSGIITPFAGGISVSGKETYTEDSDIVQPAFKRNMMNNEYVEET